MSSGRPAAEAQVLMMRLKDDLLTLILACLDGVLDSTGIRWRDEAALTVVMAARGYPGPHETDSEIRGLAEAGALGGVEIFHAGTKREGGRLLAAGGRVLNVTALGEGTQAARERAYAAADMIDFDGRQLRRDIAA